MEIVNACRDEPRETDIIREDVYFGSTVSNVKEVVDYRAIWTVYNQFVNTDTKMACGSYGIIHADNINELMSWWQEVNPRPHWLSFVKVHKTNKYDPITQWSSLQAQLDFARAIGVIWGYYKVTTKEEIMEWLSKWYIPYTWSGDIDREATKTSPNNVCVIKKWSPKHIVCSDGWDKNYMFIRNSWSLKSMNLNWEDLVHLFSIYMIVPKVDANIIERGRARMQARASKYETYIVMWPVKRQMRRVAKDAERKIVQGKNCVNIDGQWYEIIKKVS